jgi:hypothetical protein
MGERKKETKEKKRKEKGRRTFKEDMTGKSHSRSSNGDRKSEDVGLFFCSLSLWSCRIRRGWEGSGSNRSLCSMVPTSILGVLTGRKWTTSRWQSIKVGSRFHKHSAWPDGWVAPAVVVQFEWSQAGRQFIIFLESLEPSSPFRSLVYVLAQLDHSALKSSEWLYF